MTAPNVNEPTTPVSQNPAEPDPGATPAAPTPPTEPPAEPVNPLEHRFSADDGVPSWQVGKTVKEVADLSQQLYTSMVRNAPLPQGVPQPQHPVAGLQPQAPQPVTPQQPSTVDPDLWISDPGAAQAALERKIMEAGQQQFGTQFQQTYQQNAANARVLAEMRDPDTFKRWGPEIDLMLNGIPVEQRTVEVVQQAAQLVKGQHVDDLVREQAEARAKEIVEQAGQSGTLRSGGGVTGASLSPDNVLDLNDEKIPTAVKERLARERIDDDKITEFLLTARPFGNIPLDQARTKYLELLRSGTAVQAPVG